MLSPLLFNIFINDAIDIFNQHDSEPPSLISSVIGCLIYADALMILSTTAAGLQESLDKLHAYCQKLKVETNHPNPKSCISAIMAKEHLESLS